MNPLNDYPGARKALYLLQWITTGLTGIGGIYYASQSADVPTWYTLTVAILAFVWTYTGITAAQNVPEAPQDDMGLRRNEAGVIRTDGGAGVALFVLAVIGIVLLVLVLVGNVKV